MADDTQNNLMNDASGGGKPGGDTTSLFVSLYLIILAFFMVLNSISNQSQTKVKSATDSVTRAFDNPFAPEAAFVEVTEEDEAQSPNDEFYEQLQGVFASLIGFEGKFPTQGGNTIRVEVNQNSLYLRDNYDFRENQQPFFNQLANFLQNESVGTVREIEYIVYSGERFPAGPEYWKNLSILRSGALVHKLTNMGVREDQLSIGVSPGDEDLVKVTFFIRDDVTSVQDLKEADRTGLGEGTVPMPGREF